MATLKTSFTITNETRLTCSATGLRTVGELVDQHINAEWQLLNDNYESAMLSAINLSFDEKDDDMLSRMYGKVAKA